MSGGYLHHYYHGGNKAFADRKMIAKMICCVYVRSHLSSYFPLLIQYIGGGVDRPCTPSCSFRILSLRYRGLPCHYCITRQKKDNCLGHRGVMLFITSCHLLLLPLHHRRKENVHLFRGQESTNQQTLPQRGDVRNFRPICKRNLAFLLATAT